MLSQLGPLFKTTFRRAEENNARLDIPHSERDKVGKKTEEEQNKNIKDETWDDDTTVTVTALRQFLINFLKTLPGGEDSADLQSTEAQNQPFVRPREHRRPTNTRNAKAVRAYQAMAAKGQEQRKPPLPEQNIVKSDSAELLKSDELRDIHGLINDLDTIKNNGIGELRIMPADSFLDSLKNAVQAIKLEL
jgi:hypothetical protein